MENAGNQALVPREDTRREAPTKLVVARSLASATEGEVILVGRKGDVVGPGGMRRYTWTFWGLVGTLGGAAGLLVTSLTASPFLGAAAASVYVGIAAFKVRHWSSLRRGVMLLAAHRRDEAEAHFRELQARTPGKHLEPHIELYLAKLAWQRGRFDEAIPRYDRAVDLARRVRQHRSSGFLWLCLFDRVQILAAAGKVERAEKLRPELDEAPAGEYFATERMLADLLLAFHGENHRRLPDDDLYEWAKHFLALSRFGVSLILLAWAFDARGDDDMARLLLSEAPDRLEPFLDESYPEEHAWMAEKQQAWGLTESGSTPP